MSRPVEKARELLVRQDISSFRLSLETLKFEHTIVFDTFENFAKITGSPPITKAQVYDGCTFRKGGNFVILTHDSKARLHRSNSVAFTRQIQTAKLRNRWTVAHEIGHIYLKHTKDSPREENEAHAFASELLVPELVLLELRKRLGRELLANEVAKLFGVSQSAAMNCVRQIERREYFSAYLQREIMEKYRELIESYVYSCNRRATECR